MYHFWENLLWRVVVLRLCFNYADLKKSLPLILYLVNKYVWVHPNFNGWLYSPSIFTLRKSLITNEKLWCIYPWREISNVVTFCCISESPCVYFICFLCNSLVGGAAVYEKLLELVPSNSLQTYKYIEDPRLKANGIEVNTPSNSEKLNWTYTKW